MKKLLFILLIAVHLDAEAFNNQKDLDAEYQWWESNNAEGDMRPIQKQTEIQIQLTALDQQIEELKKEIRALRLREMQFEIKSEKYIKGNWDAYSQELAKAEKVNDEIVHLEKKLKGLEEKKAELQNSLRQP